MPSGSIDLRALRDKHKNLPPITLYWLRLFKKGDLSHSHGEILRSLVRSGCLRKTGRTYIITPLGMKALKYHDSK